MSGIQSRTHYTAQQKFEEAELLVAQAIGIEETHPGPDRPDLGCYLDTLAELKKAQVRACRLQRSGHTDVRGKCVQCCRSEACQPQQPCHPREGLQVGCVGAGVVICGSVF